MHVPWTQSGHEVSNVSVGVGMWVEVGGGMDKVRSSVMVVEREIDICVGCGETVWLNDRC